MEPTYSHFPSFHNTLMSAASPPSSYVCDTIPAARLASDPQPIHSPPVTVSERPTNLGATLVLDDADNITSSSKVEHDSASPPPAEQAMPRKLCVRHQRMADEGTNLKLQQVRFIVTYPLCMLNKQSSSL